MTTPTGDDGRAHLMQALHAALTSAFASEREMTIDLLPGSQLFVGKRLVAHPGAGKSARHAPAGDGYTVHVRAGAGSGPPQQRSSQPVDLLVTELHTTPLQLDRTATDQGWLLEGRAGGVIAVTARCGSRDVFDEVDRLLAVVEDVLRSVDGRDGP